MRAADAFRQGQNTMLFSSDVSARGVDYPDVSLVLQVCKDTNAFHSFLQMQVVFLSAKI